MSENPRDAAAKRAAFHALAQEKLSEIAAVLTPDARITLVARFPGYPERDLVVTNDDDLPDAIVALKRSIKRHRVKGRASDG